MTLPSDAAVSRGDVMRRLADLERQVRELAAARGLESSSIGAGGITIDVQGGLRVMHDNGQIMMEVGYAETGFGPVEQVVLHRRDGSISLQIQSNLFGFEFIRVLDAAGSALFADDGVNGQGLSVPYLQGEFASMATPTDSTASGTFTVLQKAIWRKQHAQIQAWVLHNVTSTTAEIRWRVATGPDTGTIIATSAPIGTGAARASYGPFDVPGAHLSEFEIDLEGRVASGAGAVAVRTLHAIGRGE